MSVISLEEGLAMLLRLWPLTLVGGVEEIDPSIYGRRVRVELDTIEECGRSSRDGVRGGKFPHLTKFIFSVVRIVCSVVAEFNVGLLETELVSNLLRPLFGELILASGGFSKNRWLLLKGEVLVLVHQAVARVDHALVDEVWHKLVHLPGVEMVWQWEEGVLNIDLVSHSSIEPLCVQKLFDYGVETLAIFAKQVVMQLEGNAGFVSAFNPAWVCTVDWNTVGECCGDVGDKGACECGSLHLYNS